MMIGPYIVEFLSLERLLIIEIDGRNPIDRNDTIRTEYLRGWGYRTLRVCEEEIARDVHNALRTIERNSQLEVSAAADFER